jgi:hypothetical protein
LHGLVGSAGRGSENHSTIGHYGKIQSQRTV